MRHRARARHHTRDHQGIRSVVHIGIRHTAARGALDNPRGRRRGQRRVFIHRARVAVRHRRVVDRGHVDGECVRRQRRVHPAVGRAAVVLHLELEAAVGRAVGIERRGEHQLAAADVGHRDHLAGRHRHPVVKQGARRGQGGDDDVLEGVGRGVVGIGEAQVRQQHGVALVLQHRHALVRAHRRVVHRGHVDGEGVGRQRRIHPAVGRAAVVLHLELETAVGTAVGIGSRREDELARRDVGHWHRLPHGHRHPVVE